MTSKLVFSSAAAAEAPAAPGAAATATGAAAVTPYLSSNSLTNFDISSTVMLSKKPKTSSFVTAIIYPPVYFSAQCQ